MAASEAHGIAEDRVQHLVLVLDQDIAAHLVNIDSVVEIHRSLAVVIDVGDAGIASITVDLLVVVQGADVGYLVGIEDPEELLFGTEIGLSVEAR